MPRPNRRRTQSRNASARRWKNATIPSPPDIPDEEYHADVENLELSFMQKLTLSNIQDLVEMCRLKWSTKYISVLLYMSLRYFKIQWKDIDEYLRSIGFMTAETSHKWADIFLDGDHKEFSHDSRGGKRTQIHFMINIQKSR